MIFENDLRSPWNRNSTRHTIDCWHIRVQHFVLVKTQKSATLRNVKCVQNIHEKNLHFDVSTPMELILEQIRMYIVRYIIIG